MSLLALPAIAVVIPVLIILSRFTKEARFLRRIKKMPVTPLHLCKDGDEIKVVGRATLYKESMKAALTNKNCFYYHIVVVKNPNKKTHTTLIKEEDGVDFKLTTNNTSVLVDTSRVSSYLKTGSEFYSGILKEAKPFLKNYMERHGSSDKGVLFNKDLHFTEWILEPGLRLTVIGKARWIEEEDPLDKTKVTKTLMVEALNEKGVYIIEDMKLL